MLNSIECAAKHLCTAPANATLGNHFCCKCGMHVHSVFCSNEVEALPSEIKLVFDPCKQLGSFIQQHHHGKQAFPSLHLTIQHLNNPLPP
eukprot:scaffold879_cov98-Alexandrium_tamarense.AAC.1